MTQSQANEKKCLPFCGAGIFYVEFSVLPPAGPVDHGLCLG